MYISKLFIEKKKTKQHAKKNSSFVKCINRVNGFDDDGSSEETFIFFFSFYDIFSENSIIDNFFFFDWDFSLKFFVKQEFLYKASAIFLYLRFFLDSDFRRFWCLWEYWNCSVSEKFVFQISSALSGNDFYLL